MAFAARPAAIAGATTAIAATPQVINADQSRGAKIAAAACFDPAESIGLWQRMGANAAGQAPPEFMSTHPSSDTRIQRLQGWMDEANQVRAQFCGNSP